MILPRVPFGLIKGGASFDRSFGLRSQVTPRVDLIPGRIICFLTFGEGKEREKGNATVWTGFFDFKLVEVFERRALARV